MKTKFLLLALALAGVRLAAETLASDTAVFLQTDPQSPVIARLAAGTSVTFVGTAPDGWRRVEVDGSYTVFAHSRDITKGLEVSEGGRLLMAPDKAAPVLTVAQKGDKTEVIGVRGDYCQIRLEKKLQGFVAVGPRANLPSEAPPPPPPPAAPGAGEGTAPGRPVVLTGNTADLPRLFTGILVEARRAFINPNPPYDYQLTDAQGRRFAYVDTRRLVLTDKIENLLGLQVVVSGTIRNTVDGKDLVVDAASMQRK